MQILPDMWHSFVEYTTWLLVFLPEHVVGFRPILQLMNSPPTPSLGCESTGSNSFLRASALQHAELGWFVAWKIVRAKLILWREKEADIQIKDVQPQII